MLVLAFRPASTSEECEFPLASRSARGAVFPLSTYREKARRIYVRLDHGSRDVDLEIPEKKTAERCAVALDRMFRFLHRFQAIVGNDDQGYATGLGVSVERARLWSDQPRPQRQESQARTEKWGE
jgi:hypothetical protein